MPAPLLVPIIGSAIGAFLVRLLLSLGIGFTTYFVVLPNLLQFIEDQIAALPQVAVQTLGILRFDICVTIIVSAYVAKGLGGIFMSRITP